MVRLTPRKPSRVVCSKHEDTLQGVSEFRDEFAAVEAERADADPAAVDADVAGFDVSLADPGLCSALRPPGAEVVRL